MQPVDKSDADERHRPRVAEPAAVHPVRQAVAADVQGGPRQVHQRRQIRSLFGDGVQLQAEPDEHPAQRREAGVVQRLGGNGRDDDFDDDFDDEDDVVDPELAHYLAPRDAPTLGDFLEPALAQERQRRAELARQKRRTSRDIRRAADQAEHGQRGLLKAEADRLLPAVWPLEGRLTACRIQARHAVEVFDLKKGKAGQNKAKLGTDAVEIWSNHVQAMKLIVSEFHELEPVAGQLLGALSTDLAVRTPQLQQAIASMKTFVAGAPNCLERFELLCKRANEEILFLDGLIGAASKGAAAREPDHPNVFVHRVVFGCPFFANIPFAELNRGEATGTHGKPASGAFVHKKVAGGFAITFGYVGGQAWVIDWGPKAPGSQKYAWKRGSVDYDSDAGIGEKSKYSQI